MVLFYSLKDINLEQFKFKNLIILESYESQHKYMQAIFLIWIANFSFATHWGDALMCIYRMPAEYKRNLMVWSIITNLLYMASHVSFNVNRLEHYLYRTGINSWAFVKVFMQELYLLYTDNYH